ncbi:respiratory burst oxidase homolog protein F-like [Phragmites australis]|uniref:respiratory burst oxidase homolog protein F-like n=1 Tax=Phragmites australis TaxID=29695 RepID=UPI002D79F805|nr:respiratory burst oxidase homolog protein F-like [Phragmites australis]
MASSQEPYLSPQNPAMQPSPSLSEHGFPVTPIWSTGSSPVIQFVSNVVVGGDGDALSASLSACPSTRSSSGSSSEVEIEVLFPGDDYYYDDGCTSPALRSRSSSLRGSIDGEPDLEAGRSRLLRASSLRMMEFVERDNKRELRWSAMEEGYGLSSTSQRNNADENESTSSTREPVPVNINVNPSRSISRSPSHGIRIALDSCERNSTSRITEKDIKQAIMFSASLNKLTLSQDEATQYTHLILEELQTGQGLIKLNGTKQHQSRDLQPICWPTPMPTKYGTWILSATIAFLRAHWRRIWMVLLWLVACAALFTWKFMQYRQRLAFEVMGYCLSTAKGAAETLKFNMAIVLLPVCRNTVTWLRRSHVINSVIPFNDTINFHKLVAAGIVIGIVLHGGIHLSCDFPRIVKADKTFFGRTIAVDFGYHQPSYLEIVASTEGTTGIAMVILMLIAFLLASSPSRRNPVSLPPLVRRFSGFNAFWYSHHVFIAVYVLLIVHSMFLFLAKDVAEKTTWMYVAFPVMIYLGEWMFRMVRSMVFDVKILNATTYPGKVLALKVTKPPSFRYRSGMYVFVQCPQVSKFEWHPFSLTSAPDDDHLSIHIRSLGDWSYQIYDVFQQALLSSNSDLPKISMDGPYGAASQDHSKYENILLIGLGIGATPFISVLKDIANGLDKGDDQLRKAYFYWVTREQGSFEWFRDIMKEVSALDGKQGVIEMYNYLTSVYQEGDKRSVLISTIQALHFARHGIDIISKTPVRTQFSRPNWPRVFYGLAKRHIGDRIGVFYCGPDDLGRQLERLCHNMNTRTFTRFVFHKEHF